MNYDTGFLPAPPKSSTHKWSVSTVLAGIGGNYFANLCISYYYFHSEFVIVALKFRIVYPLGTMNVPSIAWVFQI